MDFSVEEGNLNLIDRIEVNLPSHSCQALVRAHLRSTQKQKYISLDFSSDTMGVLTSPLRPNAFFWRFHRFCRPPFLHLYITTSGKFIPWRVQERIQDLLAKFTQDAGCTRNATQANGTCCCQWECSHCTQATSKEKCSSLCARRVAHPVWIGPFRGPWEMGRVTAPAPESSPVFFFRNEI